MTQYHTFLELKHFSEYKNYYLNNLCKEPIVCFDSLIVKFRPEQFYHAFYERSKRYLKSKDKFSFERAKRMSWIPICLTDNSITPLAGYDNKRKRYDHSRRVCLITPDDFVIVIRIINSREAQFVTCFVVDNKQVSQKIKKSPIWNPQKISIF